MPRVTQAELIQGLTAIVGAEHVSTSRPDRVAYSADFWPRAQIWKMGGDVERYPPDCVVWPASPAETAAVLRFCDEHAVPIVPYGGGSGVCGGTIPIHGGVVVDVKRMRRVRSLDRDSLTVVAEAGINGQHLEDWLASQGLTLGHFPSSIMCSTLGGWVAARSAGQFSSKYGKIEDMVRDVELATASGAVLHTNDRAAGAPDWTQLVVGSEGTLGVILAAELKVHPAPAAWRLRGWRFRTLKDGLRAIRAVMQAGLKPMVMRLYDPFDSMIALGKDEEPAAVAGAAVDTPASGPLAALQGFFSGAAQRSKASVGRAVSRVLEPVGRAAKRAGLIGALSLPAVVNRLAHAAPSPCLMIVGFEGPEEATTRDAAAASDILKAHGGIDGGARLGEAWLAKRYAVGFKQTKIFELGAFVDTMEVASTWDRLEGMYDAVRRALTPHVFLMAHFSHAYREGCSIYFTFAGYRKDAARAEQLYERVWGLATDAVLASGGTTSHHHGVGISKMGAMAREHGGMIKVWRALKATLDPHGVMNPGKLFPDEAVDGEGRRAAEPDDEMDFGPDGRQGAR
ncbi:MAG: FAD-binding oxidoreductase [Deltaproteobacteria bacterium]|nr:FAD-binding oxidoreductase [Deltaproteobacteria bacterium]